MGVAVSDDGWWEFHKRVAVLGLPQVPDAGIVSRYAELIAGHDERVLLLGVTRALAALGKDLTAVDLSKTQLERSWPGDRKERRAALGDWRAMQLPKGRFSAAIGDGSLSALIWPGDYRNVLERVADALEPRGTLVVRCYLAPDEPETLDQVVDDVEDGRERDWNAARWRIAMAAVDRTGSISARDLASTWRRAFPDLARLAKRTGWSVEDMNFILDSFTRSPLIYSFVTRAALLGTLPDLFVEARFVASGEYPLSERCPFLVAKRAG